MVVGYISIKVGKRKMKNRIIYDPINGERNQVDIMRRLNRSHLTDFELDEIFNDWS